MKRSLQRGKIKHFFVKERRKDFKKKKNCIDLIYEFKKKEKIHIFLERKFLKERKHFLFERTIKKKKKFKGGFVKKRFY